MAGGLRRIQHRRVRYRNHCGVYSEPDGASSQSGISRRVSGHAAQAWFGLRRTVAWLILSSPRDSRAFQTGDPALERWAIFFSCLSALKVCIVTIYRGNRLQRQYEFPQPSDHPQNALMPQTEDLL